MLQKDQTGFVSDSDNLSLPGPLSESWLRSRHYGLDRTDDLVPFVRPALLNEVRGQNGWVAQLARPLIERLGGEINRQPSIVVVSDAKGLVLETCGNSHFLRKASRISLAPGNLWGEQARGTNAIGTALALGSLCEVNGDEHFLNQNTGLYCSAAPIYRPDGLIAGVLDISTPAQRPFDDARSLILQAVRHIEHQWVMGCVTSQHWTLRLHSDARVLGSAHELILVFRDEVLTAANRLAMQEFNLSAASFGTLDFATLFPEMQRQTLNAPRQTLAVNNRHYYSLLQMPERHSQVVRPRELPFDRDGADRQKALRILNAGLALCISGETGCGKEYFSQRLFEESHRRQGNFVAINCAALPENLIESELFGYAPGAFTGANPKGYLGKIREADGGVLFLDEIGDMPLSLQTRLLRVLQEKTVTPLGSRLSYAVDFSLICATHQDLAQQVAAGAFREDLMYRIQEFNLRILPLRQRAHVDRFILNLWRELGAESRSIRLAPETVAVLARYPWPGNVRQLLSTLKVLLALADDGELITPDALPEQFGVLPLPADPHAAPQEMLDAIRSANGNISLAAKRLGVSRSTLYRKMEKRRGRAVE
ncbi:MULTISPECIES: sigma-54-dependent Fis family transcriptional regulator [Serratia]|uniref:Acetoin catabolism regulatory protein n=1 Tax=Serratia quinivorans TaxID=137545 RepID=A0A380B2H1_9GAMM|nr:MULTISPECIES: sigma-54-dependent Fis family transcriptional regulator [Serratia]QBX65407.1 sigma-54-dependent Fis family transcriptional regulator [Serratia quinivorans]RYM60741.1 sigma-54-dependent Fis family transcriptional regulator [Serratia proteamaculans]CAI1643889.1 Acetoin catabolism regulatory protein [Serratia quinivorans]SUI90894.1 Acetoin catabolism regulatory protein [Serratia quinivorans]